MNSLDVKMLIAYCAELWPNYRLPADDAGVNLRVRAWLDVAGDLDANDVRAALAECSGAEFAPPIGRLRDLVIGQEIRDSGDGPPDADQAWAEFLEACRHGIYDVPEWSHPAIADAARGFDVRALALEDEADLLNVTQAHFRRAYELCVNRWRRANVRPAPAVAGSTGGELAS